MTACSHVMCLGVALASLSASIAAPALFLHACLSLRMKLALVLMPQEPWKRILP